MPEPAAPEDVFGLVGTLLERKYRVDRCVAEGGFGVVYAGHHIGLDTPIAIKVLRVKGNVDPDTLGDFVAQFLDEAKTIAKLRHPAVVSVLDSGVTIRDDHPEGLPWMVMEWLEGKTLREDLAARRGKGGRSIGETFRLMRPVLEALAQAHEMGIAHRDLKPSNIMLVRGRRGESARVLDFGIAKLMSGERASTTGHTTTNAVVKAFSAASAAPEQLSGTRTGPWTDVHALGLLLVELLTDQSPYPLEDAQEHYRAVFDTNRPTPKRFGVDCGAWEPVLAKALALKPNERYESAGALLAALEESLPLSGVTEGTEKSVSLDGPRTSSPPTGSTTRTLIARARTPWVLGLPLLVAIAVLVYVARSRPGTGGGTSAPPVASKCESAAACTKAAGRPAVCRREIGCVALASEDCEVQADPAALASEDTVWIGSMFPKTGPDGEGFGIANARAVDLARRDFAQIMAGLQAADRARPFGVVSCDDAVDPKRAAHHLAERVGVPAVIGFHSSVEAIDLATSLFVPKRVLSVAALNTNPLVTTVPQPAGEPRLVWRTTYNNTEAAGALSSLVEHVLEPSMRAGPELGASGTMRVALLRPKNAAGAAFSDALFRSLRFNAKSALDNGYDFRELTFDADATAQSPELAAAVKELTSMAPHVVVYAGGTVLVQAVFARLEAAWPASAKHRPRYASLALLPRELFDYIGTSKDLRRRFFGVTPLSTTASNARFVMHYNETFDDEVTRTIAPNTSYDAFYLLAYATYALGRHEAVTGPALARGITRLLPPGKPVDVGLSGIFDAYATLRAGGRIDLQGATGKLDFDPATGEAPFDHAILCVGVDDHGRAFDGVESGLVYSAASKRLEGKMSCP
jgi:serine/threonine-protein kinase